MPLDGPIDPDVADKAKIFAAPDDPSDWPAWREQLTEWRDDARRRVAVARTAVGRLGEPLLQHGLVWLWDERLFDHDARRFTPARLLADAGVRRFRRRSCCGTPTRSSASTSAPSSTSTATSPAWPSGAEFHERGVEVFVDYNPWDIGHGGDADDRSPRSPQLGRGLGADGVFLDTMSEGGRRPR